MDHITTSAHGLTTEQRPDGRHTREVFVDDELVCSASPPIVGVTIIDQPGGTPATITGGTIQCHEVGKHLFRVDFADHKSAHLHVMAMERACLDRIPDQQTDRHLPARSFAEKCLILRSLCNSAPNFDGASESISFDRVGSLAQYGA